jgi:membrane protease YdiL (CAAX protease family)
MRDCGQFSLGDFLLSLLKLLGLYLAILLFSALLTPAIAPLFHAHGDEHGLLFHRIFDRLRYVGFFLCLPFVWRMARIRSFSDLGWGSAGMAVLLAVLGAVSVIGLGCFLTGNFEGIVLPDGFIWIIGRGIRGALLVALLEEFLFRGILQRYLSLSAGTCVGVLATSLLFALLHGRPETSGLPDHGFAGGFGLMWMYVNGGSFTLPQIVFVNMALLGISLGVLYARSKSLLPSMGLHFGAVAAAIPLAAVLKENELPAMDIVGSGITTMLLVAWIALAIIWPMDKRTA